MYVENLSELITKARKNGYVKISTKWLTKKVNCTPEGLKLCEGKCCNKLTSNVSKGVFVKIWDGLDNIPPEWQKYIDNNIVKNTNGVCSLQPYCIDNPQYRPIECKLYPLNFNSTGRLILEQRCQFHCPNYNKGNIPIYIAIKDNLIDIFGITVYNNMVKEINGQVNKMKKYKNKQEGEKDIIREKDRRKKKHEMEEEKEDVEEDNQFERASY